MAIETLRFSALGLLLLLPLVTQGAGGLAEPAHAPETMLEAARVELRAREAAYERMRARYDVELEAGRLSREERMDYRAFLDRLARLVGEQRRTLTRLEGSPAAGAAGDARPGRLEEGFSPGQTEAEEVSSLDRELGASLSEFDEMLLREQKELAEKARSAGTGAAGDGAGEEGADGRGGEGGGGGAGEAGEPGEDVAGAPADGARSASQGAGEERRDGRAGSESADSDSGGEERDGRQVADAGGAKDRGGVGGRQAAPGDVPDAGDDDVVARQLREAAENEQDPELREKLWEEYRRYKSRGQ